MHFITPTLSAYGCCWKIHAKVKLVVLHLDITIELSKHYAFYHAKPSALMAVAGHASRIA